MTLLIIPLFHPLCQLPGELLHYHYYLSEGPWWLGCASPLGIEIVILDSSTKRLFLLYSRQPSQPRLI